MRKFFIAVVLLVFMAAGGRAVAQTTLIGPSPSPTIPYLQFSDSPFAGIDFSGGYFHFEDFEDHLLDTPGVSGNTGGVNSVVFGPGAHDSVDADDGTIDGSGLLGDSWISSAGNPGVTFTFDATVLGELPTHAGMVWTDGIGPITFEAFDANGVSLGVLSGNHDGGSVFTGETNEDRFYGVIHLGGISAIRLSNSTRRIEIDHLQYGRQAADLDGDGKPDATDNCPNDPNPDQLDTDGDGAGDICDDDDDDDGVNDTDDNCPLDVNPDQFDIDGDSIGDVCDPDDDNDGIDDTSDSCTNSDMSTTVIIEGCDSGVENTLFDNGCTIADLVMACVEDASNHGQFTSCVSNVTNNLKKDSVISGKDKGAIQSCAAQSSLP